MIISMIKGISSPKDWGKPKQKIYFESNNATYSLSFVQAEKLVLEIINKKIHFEINNEDLQSFGGKKLRNTSVGSIVKNSQFYYKCQELTLNEWEFIKLDLLKIY